MAEIHSATSGTLVRELVQAVRAEAGQWADHAVAQAAGINPTSPTDAARFAIEHLLTDLDDHLGIALSVVLATCGIDASGEVPRG